MEVEPLFLSCRALSLACSEMQTKTPSVALLYRGPGSESNNRWAFFNLGRISQLNLAFNIWLGRKGVGRVIQLDWALEPTLFSYFLFNFIIT